jgi:hypothetical protein
MCQARGGRASFRIINYQDRGLFVDHDRSRVVVQAFGATGAIRGIAGAQPATDHQSLGPRIDRRLVALFARPVRTAIPPPRGTSKGPWPPN